MRSVRCVLLAIGVAMLTALPGYAQETEEESAGQMTREEKREKRREKLKELRSNHGERWGRAAERQASARREPRLPAPLCEWGVILEPSLAVEQQPTRFLFRRFAVSSEEDRVAGVEPQRAPSTRSTGGSLRLDPSHPSPTQLPMNLVEAESVLGDMPPLSLLRISKATNAYL